MQDGQTSRSIGLQGSSFQNGEFRCFLNASLQLLYSSEHVRNELRRVQQRTHPEIRRRLLHAAQALSCTRAMKDNIVTTNEERLSITLEVLESKQQCDTMFPHLILNTFYEGVQCDAHELLMRLLAMESRKTRQLAKRIARRLTGKKTCTKPGKKDPGKMNPEKKDPGMKDMTTGNNHGEKIPGKKDPEKKND